MTKPDLVLIHGFRGSPLGLDKITQDLRRAGYKVYTPALPPFAGAKIQQGQYRPETYAEYLRHYIEDQHLERPVLIGHSMGSVVVSATAKYYSDLINQKLILLSPISTKPPRPIAAISPLANYLPANLVDYITSKFLFVSANKNKNPNRNLNQFREIMGITHQCSHDHPPSKSELSAAMRFSTRYSVADFIPELKNDVIMIAGAKDRLISQTATKKLAQKSGAKLSLIPDSGHLHNYEKPHETAQVILELLQN